jgi:hypothetical protein
MRSDFEMTWDDLSTLLQAMKPAPMIMLQCGTPRSVQENANAAWARLGEKMGFDPMSVRPNGKGDRFFSAMPVPAPTPCKGIEIEPGVFSGCCSQAAGDCPECGK